MYHTDSVHPAAFLFHFASREHYLRRLLETVTDSEPIKLFSRERGRKVAWVEHLLQGLISSLQDGAGQEAEVGKR